MVTSQGTKVMSSRTRKRHSMNGQTSLIKSPIRQPVIPQVVNIMEPKGGVMPPIMMFTTCGITGCKISSFIKEVWPFILCLFLVLLLITFIPRLVTIVPDLVYGAASGNLVNF